MRAPRPPAAAADAPALELEQLPLVIYIDALDESSSNLYTSPQVEQMLGYTVRQWRDDKKLFVKLLHPEDRERVLAAHRHTHETHEPLSAEYRLRARSGEYIWIRDEGVVVTDENGTPLHLQGYMLDISAVRDAEERLRKQAMYDPLTGLANRVWFNERLEHALAVQRRSTKLIGLLFIDIDNFKSINDRFGHHSGDLALGTIARHLAGAVRPGDTAARLGGDEFAVILHDIDDASAAAAVAERLHRGLAEPIDIDGRRLSIDASIGIAVGTDAETLLKEADAAMYRAKASPGIRFAFFDPRVDHAALKRFRRLGELGEALGHDELRLHYQPIVNLETSQTEGYEALLRWQHPTDGELPPMEFIPLAEDSGLIVPIGGWVLRQACAHGAALSARDGREYEMSVNVSARQLQHPTFVEEVDAALRSSGLPPSQLVLEITESVLIDTTDVDERLRALKTRGVKIALDDFGTGYGSLSYLQRLPVDIVKIDRSFTATLDTDSSGEALVSAIVGLGAALGTRLTAEGIERESQSEIIKALGCKSAQGFHFGYPEPPEGPAVIRSGGEGAAPSPASAPAAP